MSIIFEEKQKPRYLGEQARPRIISWKNEKMIRTESFRAAVKQIAKSIKTLDVVTVGLVGPPSSGKSELARAIRHQLHEMSDIPFALREFGKTELANFKETMLNLPPVNHILIFDDLSFMGADFTSKQILTLKSEFTTIRHFEGRPSVKMVLIYNFHYSPGFDKYLRQTTFKFWTGVGEAESDFILKTVKQKNIQRIVSEFQKQCSEAISKGYWTKQISKKEKFSYKYRDPFIPTLFWDGISIRPVVTPRRQWIQGDQTCTLCESAMGNNVSTVNIEDFIKHGREVYSSNAFETAVKIEMLKQGKVVFGKQATKAVKWLEKQMKLYNIPIDQVATALGMTTKKIRIREDDFTPDPSSSLSQKESS